MSDAEDAKIDKMMRHDTKWYAYFCTLSDEILTKWANDVPSMKNLNKYWLALELMDNSSYFWGNDPAFDPFNREDRDYLAHWCQRWLDKQRLSS